LILRAVVCGTGLAVLLSSGYSPDAWNAGMLAVRWLVGLVGTAVLLVLTWIIIKIPNTQSATGVLYVGVIFTFLGELTSQLLSADTACPL
ncbi:MAG: hypothetical protein N2C14_05405, partial [Planctomycetales bacterium]